MNIVKVIAVNFIALIDIVFMLISTVMNLISKLVSRSFILILGFLLIVALGVGQSFGFDRWLLMVFLYTIIFAIFGVAIVYAGAIIMGIAMACASIFATIAGFVQGVSEALLKKCDDMTSEKDVPEAACPLFLFAKGLKGVIDTAAGILPALAVFAAVGVIILTPVIINIKLKSAFGVGIFGYLGLFPKGESIFAVIYGILAVATVAVTLVSFSFDLGESIEEIAEES